MAIDIEMVMYSEIVAPGILAALPKNLTDRWVRDKWETNHSPTFDEILKELDADILIKERDTNQ
jgi:hypothetical protein